MTNTNTASGAEDRYTKNPITITASQWFKNGDHPGDHAPFVGSTEQDRQRYDDYLQHEGKVVRYYRRPDVPGESLCEQCGKPHHIHGWIDTLEQGHRVCPGDWIITGVKGERYPCKPDIFEETYSPAAPAQQPTPLAAPAGFAIVPVDATDAMMAAFANAAAADIDWHGATEVERQGVRDGFGPAYRAMLAAVPVPQADSQPAQAVNLHPKTADLVQRFATALAEKLAEAEKKYGYSVGWESPEWMDECRACLLEHISKGDPRDVAAYCAFLWHHGESTVQAEDSQPLREGEWINDAGRIKWLLWRVQDLEAKLAARAPADSVLEDAAPNRRSVNRYCRANMCLESDQNHEHDCPQGHAARKQGGAV